MMVKNKGSEFMIELEEDYELNRDLGYLDLAKVRGIVFDCLKFDG
jgi:hypothetical protein